MSKPYDTHLELYEHIEGTLDGYRSVGEIKQVPSDFQLGDIVESLGIKHRVFERSWYCSPMYQTLYIKAVKI